MFDKNETYYKEQAKFLWIRIMLRALTRFAFPDALTEEETMA